MLYFLADCSWINSRNQTLIHVDNIDFPRKILQLCLKHRQLIFLPEHQHTNVRCTDKISTIDSFNLWLQGIRPVKCNVNGWKMCTYLDGLNSGMIIHQCYGKKWIAYVFDTAGVFFLETQLYQHEFRVWLIEFIHEQSARNTGT